MLHRCECCEIAVSENDDGCLLLHSDYWFCSDCAEDIEPRECEDCGDVFDQKTEDGGIVMDKHANAIIYRCEYCHDRRQ